MNRVITIVLALPILSLLQPPVFAQQPQSKCSQVEYSQPDFSLQSYRLDRIEGQAVYASPAQKWELGSANGVCLTLFNRKNGAFAASTTSDANGQFEFVNIVPAEYVLIGYAGDLQRLSIPIELAAPEKSYQPLRLLLHLREKEDKRKSYVTAVTQLALRNELLARVAEDQKIRDAMIKSGVDHPGKAIMKRMQEIGLRNANRMRSIIKEHGWPGPELVGWDGTEAAFTLVQHADHSFQKELLPLMQKEYNAEGLSGPNYALFIDRVLVDGGRPQIYGSQAKPFEQWQNGEPTFYPIEDEPHVNNRRAQVGLSSLAEYRKLLKQMYYPKRK